MPQGRISKRTVDALKCPADKDRVFLWDDDLSGFGVAAFPTGKKVYVAQFRKDGKSRRAKIGLHGRLTPDEARSEARKLLGDVERGFEERRKARAVRTLKAVAEDYLATHVAKKKRPRTLESYRVLLDKHILPIIGDKRIKAIKRVDIVRLHSGMSEIPGAANRCLTLISAIWNWAAKLDEVAEHENPAKGIERNPETGCERYLSTDELARLGDALRQAETAGLTYKIDETKAKAKHAPKPENRNRMLDPFAVAAIRLLIFTGARLREILHAEWEQVDFERGMIHLTKSKTGKKPIFLSSAAMDVLANLPQIEGNPHVIPGSKNGAPRSDLKKPWAAVIEAAALPGLRIHDLRHSFASIGAGASMSLHTIGRLLGHAQPRTTAKYAHLDVDPMRRAVDTIGANIQAAMEGKQRKNVKQMPKIGRR